MGDGFNGSATGALAALNPELIILLTAKVEAIAIPKANVRGANRRPYFVSL